MNECVNECDTADVKRPEIPSDALVRAAMGWREYDAPDEYSGEAAMFWSALRAVFVFMHYSEDSHD